MTIAVIGAGVAGAACARRLADAARAVVLFDKGRGAGGRLSARRAETPLGAVLFDHGGQYITARVPAFVETVSRWGDQGAAAVWDGPFATLSPTGSEPVSPSTARWVGAPGMNAVVRAALDGLDARFGAEVEAIEGAARAWRLRLRDGEQAGPFETVVCATPAEQAAPLLAEAAPALAEQARLAVTAPCWSVMAVFEHPPAALFSAAKVSDSPLAWVARQCGKPGRTRLGEAAEAWVLHASAAWSRAHLEDDAEAVVNALIAAFRERVEAAAPIWTAAHRWRFAQVEQAVGAPFGLDVQLGLASCGDWRLGPRVELAWTSGDALGRALAAG